MPTLPRIDPTLNRLRPQPQSRRVEAGGGVSEAIVRLGEAGQKIAETLKKASLLHEKTKAQNELNASFKDIQSRAAQDPDTSADRLRHYNEEINKAIANSSKHITIPFERSVFNEEALGIGNIASVRLQNDFNAKNIAMAKVELDNYEKGTLEGYATSASDMEREKFKLDYEVKLKEKRDAGFLSPADYEKRRTTYQEEWETARAEYDISVDPVTTKKLIEQGHYRIGDLNKPDMIKKADTAINKISVDLEDSLYDKFIEGTLTIDEVLNAGVPKDEGGVGAKKARTLLKQLSESQTVTLKNIAENNNDALKYIDLVNKSLVDPVDRFRAKQIIVDSVSDGTIDNKEAKKISEIKSVLQDLKFNVSSDPFTNSIKTIKSWFGANNPDSRELAVSLRKLINGYEPGKQSESITDDILKESYNKTYPQVPLGKDDKVNDPKRERNIVFETMDKFLGFRADLEKRILKGVGAGVFSTIEGAGASLESMGKRGTALYVSPLMQVKVKDKTLAEHIGGAISDKAKKIREERLSVPDPGFIDQLSAGVGSMSTFFVPGLGIAKGLQMASFAPRVSAWVGISASSFLEASVEGGAAYKRAIESGVPSKQAGDVGSSVFWANVPLLAVTNRLGVFGEAGETIGRMLKTGVIEGIQEASQEVISNIVGNDDLLQGVASSFTIGAIVGGGTSVLSQNSVAELGPLDEAKIILDKLKSEKGQAQVFPEEQEQTTVSEDNLQTVESEEVNIDDMQDEDVLNTSFNKDQINKFTDKQRQRVLSLKIDNAQAEQHKQNIVNKYGSDITNPPKPPTTGGFDESFYEDNRRRLNSKERQKKEGGFVSNTSYKSTALDEYLTPISSRLNRIQPELRRRMRKFEFDTGQSVLKDQETALPLLETTRLMDQVDQADFDLARKNGDIAKIDQIVRKYGLKVQYDQVRNLLDDLHKRAKEVGLDIGYVENYHPRMIKDVQGFLDYFRNGQYWSIINEALTKKEIELGRYLTEEERAYAINSLLRGYGFSNIKLSRPGNLKQREIEVITPELNQFYANSNESLVRYIQTINEHIEAKKFFGKGEGSLDQSIGAYTARLLAEGKITPNQELELRDIFQARFNARGTGKMVSVFKNLSYIDTMGSPISAITQLGDMAWSLYRNGFYLSGKSFLKSVQGKSELTKKDLGIDKISEEFTDLSKSGKALKNVFKFTGFEWMDGLGKETLVNSSVEKLRKGSKRPTKKFKERIENVFGEESAQVIDDLKSGKMTENIKLLAFSEISDFQPISLSEMPQKYINGGNGRVFYMLKSFTIKQVDVFRNEAFDKIARGDVKEGLSNLIQLGSVFVLANASADVVKNIVLGRPTDMDDIVIDNILRAMGFSKFQLYKARTEGIGSATITSLRPPTKLIDSAYKDIRNIVNSNIDELNDLETIQSIPLIGKMYYWWFGKGHDKSNKKRGKKGVSFQSDF